MKTDGQKFVKNQHSPCEQISTGGTYEYWYLRYGNSSEQSEHTLFEMVWVSYVATKICAQRSDFKPTYHTTYP